jgi:hypothetical protein
VSAGSPARRIARLSRRRQSVLAPQNLLATVPHVYRGGAVPAQAVPLHQLPIAGLGDRVGSDRLLGALHGFIEAAAVHQPLRLGQQPLAILRPGRTAVTAQPLVELGAVVVVQRRQQLARVLQIERDAVGEPQPAAVVDDGLADRSAQAGQPLPQIGARPLLVAFRPEQSRQSGA